MKQPDSDLFLLHINSSGVSGESGGETGRDGGREEGGGRGGAAQEGAAAIALHLIICNASILEITQFDIFYQQTYP